MAVEDCSILKIASGEINGIGFEMIETALDQIAPIRHDMVGKLTTQPNTSQFLRENRLRLRASRQIYLAAIESGHVTTTIRKY